MKLNNYTVEVHFIDIKMGKNEIRRLHTNIPRTQLQNTENRNNISQRNLEQQLWCILLT